MRQRGKKQTVKNEDEDAPFVWEPAEAAAPAPLPPPQPAAPAADIVTDGNLEIVADAHVRQSISVRGALTVAQNAQIERSVSAGGGARFNDGVRIGGSLQVTGPLHWGRGASAGTASIEGPLITDGGLVRARSLTASAGIRPRHAGEVGA